MNIYELQLSYESKNGFQSVAQNLSGGHGGRFEDFGEPHMWQNGRLLIEKTTGPHERGLSASTM
jgi:hypothetical protein